MKWIFGFLFGIIGSSSIVSFSSYAGLGDHSETIARDAHALKANRNNADVFRQYSIQEMDSDATHIKEYISNDGVIFAITWKGLDHPDLSVLLGKYSATYEKGLKEKPRKLGRRHQKVEKENLVVQKWGRMRNLQGRAYDPSLIPAGVTIDEIK